MCDGLLAGGCPCGGPSDGTGHPAGLPAGSNTPLRGGPGNGHDNGRVCALTGTGDSAAMAAGSFHPPFSFRSCRKENGPWTVQKKRTLAQTCTCVQVCFNTKVFRIVADEDKRSSAGRDQLRQFRFSASAAAGMAEASGRFRIPCPPGPAAATLAIYVGLATGG